MFWNIVTNFEINFQMSLLIVYQLVQVSLAIKALVCYRCVLLHGKEHTSLSYQGNQIPE